MGRANSPADPSFPPRPPPRPGLLFPVSESSLPPPAWGTGNCLRGGACAQEAAGLEVSPRGFAPHGRGRRWAGRAGVRLRGFSGARRLLCPQGPLGACACPLLTLSRSCTRYPLPHGASKCCQLLGLVWAGHACSLQPNRRLLGKPGSVGSALGLRHPAGYWGSLLVLVWGVRKGCSQEGAPRALRPERKRPAGGQGKGRAF